MPSFDIVNRLDMQEFDNAINNTKKEIATRYDFRNTDTEVDLDKKEKRIRLQTADEMKMRSLREMLIGHCVRRKIDPKCLDFKTIEPTSKGHVKMDVVLKDGVPDDVARKIVKMVKENKLKVQTAIQGDQLRVSGKKIDDLQLVIGMVKAENFEVPLQYINMKS